MILSIQKLFDGCFYFFVSVTIMRIDLKEAQQNLRGIKQRMNYWRRLQIDSENLIKVCVLQ
ncbi:unnamed protein product [Paramecium sonneborni]|uniref:Uncharacterized protein n=1 Tax=Paramecium sonneborni TaxID=65129 RepID=A0A8S1MBK6_9CILI|nr:unnamed protein product [Paramecium sonneborni]